jgi:hypothetical protein
VNHLTGRNSHVRQDTASTRPGRPTACASADARRELTVHRPAARCEAEDTGSKLGQPPAGTPRGLQAAGGQLHALVRKLRTQRL